jgi:hypothetical protein
VRILRTDSAVAQLQSIHNYIAQTSPEYALRIVALTKSYISSMAKIWKEELDPSRHCHKMDGVVAYAPKIGGLHRWIYFVRVCSFTFEFHSLEQIKKCLDYYSMAIHQSSRMDIGGADHWEMQRWFERLPMYLLEEPRRQKVVKALSSAMEEFAAD